MTDSLERQLAEVEEWIAVYGRASKDRDEKRISVERQLDQGLARAAEKFPGVPVRTYCDNDLSAADPDVYRPDYHRLLGDVAAGRVRAVIANRQSRVSRQPVEMEQLYLIFTAAGLAEIETIENGPVAVGPGNRLLTRVMGAVDAHAVEESTRLTRAEMAKMAAEGRPGGGRAYGYRREVGPDQRAVLVIEEAEAEVVRQIAGWVLHGFSLTAIADKLNAQGTPTARGAARWTNVTVRQVIEKPTIAGLRGHKVKAERGRPGYGELHAGRWEPILDDVTWRRVRKALGQSTVLDAAGRRFRVSRSPHNTTRRWLLTGGLAICGVCKGPLVVIPKEEGAHCYACLNRGCGKLSVRPAEMLEELVAEKVFAALDNPEMARRLTDDPDPRKDELLAELAAAEADMTEAVSLKGQGVYTAQQRDDQFFPAKHRAAFARAALGALPAPDLDLPPVDQIRDKWLEEGAMTLRQKRALLEMFLEHVEVGKGRVGRSPKHESPQERIDRRLEPPAGPKWRD